MSVKINKTGQLIVTSEAHNSPAENYHNRLKALIQLLQMADYKNTDDNVFFNVLDILEDYLPTPEQSKIMFNTTPENAESIKQMIRELNGKIEEKEATTKEVLTEAN
jgi:hypothetical protein